MKQFILGITLAALMPLFVAPAEASIKISLNPSNIVPGSSRVSFESGAVDPDGGNSGFLGTLYDSSGNVALESWETFCVEAGAQIYSEQLNFGVKYVVGSVASSVASATGNFVTDAAKLIYYRFGHGGLTGWVPDDGEAVQQAIWNQVQGGGMGGPPLIAAVAGKAAQWVNEAIAALTNPATMAEAMAQASRIRVLNPVALNPTDGSFVHRQSVLYEIPEASTIAVWSILGLLGLGTAYRNRFKALVA